MTQPGITPIAARYHPNGIDFTQLKVSHINVQSTANLISWSTTLALLPLESVTHKTAVIDSKRGVYKIKEPTDTLIHKYFSQRMSGCQQVIRQLDYQAGIKEYRPVSHGNATFFPMKANCEHKNRIWIANHHMELPMQFNNNSADLFFKDCQIRLRVPYSLYFIKSRRDDCAKHDALIQSAWDEIKAYTDTPIEASFRPCYVVQNVIQGVLFKFSKFLLAQFDIPIKDEEVEAIIKQFMHHY